MSRISSLSNPFLLGFDEVERALDRVTKGSEGYPPYNVERIDADGGPLKLRITLAVAGFTSEQLEITLEEKELTIRGRQTEEVDGRVFLHRGIAARQFQRTFVLAEGMNVLGAELRNGLLSIDLVRPEPTRLAKRIDIVSRS
ncbi:Hsp20 family protein [Aquabacter sp. L1I39]|uniref:Hsp20 family protein n=1 Tax=Aquabacter sp. L1I39 TaxID=2820278 RepID=UPI001ADA8768|nr:Hsp20 family protein [Aquabacter sp. L1I39]QTL04858.1 Hsp20 family protein [Aquabacter sp. L1I39]